MRALEVLFSLGALDDGARLTRPTGVMLADLPLEPMLGKALLCSGEMGCSEEMLTVAATLQARAGPRAPPAGYSHRLVFPRVSRASRRALSLTLCVSAGRHSPPPATRSARSGRRCATPRPSSTRRAWARASPRRCRRRARNDWATAIRD